MSETVNMIFKEIPTVQETPKSFSCTSSYQNPWKWKRKSELYSKIYSPWKLLTPLAVLICITKVENGTLDENRSIEIHASISEINSSMNRMNGKIIIWLRCYLVVSMSKKFICCSSDKQHEKEKQIDFISQLKHGTMLRKNVCLCDGKCNQVRHFCRAFFYSIFKYYFRFSTPRERNREWTKEKQSWKSSFLLLRSQIWCYPFIYPSAFWGLNVCTISEPSAFNIRSLACLWKTLDKCNFTKGVKWIGFVQQSFVFKLQFPEH